MKVQVYYTGKTTTKYLRAGEEIYEKRLGHYLPIEFAVIPDVKQAGKLAPDKLRALEGERILAKVRPEDKLILLDENGQQYRSTAFSDWLSRELQGSARQLIFVVGGAFGFSAEVYARANGRLSLSEMTFSHQMIRLFFTEQLYRAMTILKNEKYHNE